MEGLHGGELLLMNFVLVLGTVISRCYCGAMFYRSKPRGMVIGGLRIFMEIHVFHITCVLRILGK